MKLNFLITLALLLICSACGERSIKKDIDTYYDIEGLFQRQTKLLSSFSFEKSATIDGKSEKGIVRFDTTGWKKELSMFAGLDINKSALTGSYEISEEAAGTGKKISYRLRPGEESGVKWIELVQDEQGRVKELEALFQEANSLYQNQRALSARFQTENGQSVLKNYHIKGYQKILLKDTVHYEISAERN